MLDWNIDFFFTTSLRMAFSSKLSSNIFLLLSTKVAKAEVFLKDGLIWWFPPPLFFPFYGICYYR